MAIERITDMADGRVAAYRDLKDRELAREGGRFIAEGEIVVRRLLASPLRVQSVLLAERRVDEVAPIIPDDVPIYVAPDAVIEGVMGFAFHSGVIACGLRPEPVSLDEQMARWCAQPAPITLLICPQIINHDNLGSLIRIASAFGVTGMILGERSADPYYRRSIRVSMGTAFTMPLLQSARVIDDLNRLRDHWGVTLAATVTDADAIPLAQARRPTSPDRLGLLVGPEDQGLYPGHVRPCQQRVTIPMQLGTDSLNVAIATAVCLYHYTQAAGAAR